MLATMSDGMTYVPPVERHTIISAATASASGESLVASKN